MGANTAHSLRFMRYAAYMSLFCLLCGLGLFVFHTLLRFALDVDLNVVPPLKLLVVLTAICTAFFALPAPCRNWLLEKPCLIPLVPLGVFLAVFLGWWGGAAVFYIFLFLALCGVKGIIPHMRFSSFEWKVLLSASFVYMALFFVWANATFQTYSVGNSVEFTSYYPISVAKEFSFGPNMYLDYYFHSAIIYMLQAWGKASVGLDGLVPLYYHMAGHAWFASFGRILGTDPFITVSGAVLFVLFSVLYQMFFLFMLTARKALHSSKVFYLIVALIFIKISDIVTNDFASYGSITAAPAIIILLAFLPLLLLKGQRLMQKHALFAPLLIGLAVTLLLGVFKIQAGLLVGGLGGYFLLRRSFSLRQCLMVILVFFVIVSGLVELYGPANVMFWNDLFRNFGLLGVFDKFIYVLFNNIYIFWPLYLYILLYFPRYQNVAKASQHTLSKKYFYNEVILAGAFLAILPVIYPGAQDWFPRTFYWIGLALLCSHPYCESRLVPFFKKSIHKLKVEFTDPTLRKTNRLAKVLVIFCVILLGDGLGVFLHYIAVKSHANFDVVYSVLHGDAISLKPAVEQILQIENKKGLAVFIPESNTAFWRFGFQRIIRSHMIPSLTGIPLLNGVPPPATLGVDCFFNCGLDGYGYMEYSLDSVTGNYSDSELCRHAQEKAITHVYIFQDMVNMEANRLLNC